MVKLVKPGKPLVTSAQLGRQAMINTELVIIVKRENTQTNREWMSARSAIEGFSATELLIRI